MLIVDDKSDKVWHTDCLAGLTAWRFASASKSLYQGYSILDDVTYSISDESQTEGPSAVKKGYTHVPCLYLILSLSLRADFDPGVS